MSHLQVPNYVFTALESIRDNDIAVKNYGIYFVTKMCKILIAHGVKNLHFQTLNMDSSVKSILEVIIRGYKTLIVKHYYVEDL